MTPASAAASNAALRRYEGGDKLDDILSLCWEVCETDAEARRLAIYTARRNGFTLAAIAEAVGRDESTVRYHLKTLQTDFATLQLPSKEEGA